MVIKGVVTFSLPIFWLTNYVAYDEQCPGGDGVPCPDFHRPFPWWLVCTFDYTWFVCLAFTPLFLPKNPVPVATAMKLVPREELQPQAAPLV